MIAVVRESQRRRRGPLLLMALLSECAALGFSWACPDFSSEHALLLSCGVCLALWGFNGVRHRLGGPSMVCDGRWLSCCSWLIGYLVDLDELHAVRATRQGAHGTLREIAICARKRELLRIDLGQWRREDVQALLTVLLESHPQTQFDSPTRLWLQPLQGMKPSRRG